MKRAAFLLAAVLAFTAAAQDSSSVRDWISSHAVRLATPEASHGFDDMEPLRQVVGDARIVALGEATHGTSEFFRFKHRMVEFLASQMGFTIFGIEANLPEAYRLNDYVLHGTGDPAALIRGMYFWTWNTREVLAMVEWMRQFNASGKGKIQFTGFDMQTPDVAAKIVGDFVAAQEPAYAPAVEKATRLALAPAAQPDLPFASATGAFPIDAAAGMHVRFSGYIKTQDVSGYAGLWWRADGAGRSLAFRDLDGAAPQGTRGWKRYALEIAVPAETRNINFGALLAGKGTAWFDGLAVEINGVRYENEAVFRPFEPASYQQGPYRIEIDNETVHEGRAALRIRRQSQPAGAVDPKKSSAAWSAVVAHMEASRAGYGAGAATEWAIQNARIVLQGMQERSGEVSRDRSMAANIQWILAQNPGAKMVVWAHNAHVSFGGGRGPRDPMGEWLRQAYGDALVVFGFAFNQGSFRAVEVGKVLREFTVPAAPAGTVDAMLASAGIPLFALDLRQLPQSGPVAGWFFQPHRARSIGSMYSEAHAANYFVDQVPPRAYDVLLFVDKTTAAQRIGPPQP